MTEQNYPITTTEFKEYFDRDFPYSKDEADLSGVRDKDILRACGEAQMSFNSALWSNESDKKTAFLYLTAHYLVIDLNNASKGIGGMGGSGFITSRSVGNVSEGLSIPQWLLEIPAFSLIADTVYGKKFLRLLLPKIPAYGCMAVCGRTLP